MFICYHMELLITKAVADFNIKFLNKIFLNFIEVKFSFFCFLNHPRKQLFIYLVSAYVYNMYQVKLKSSFKLYYYPVTLQSSILGVIEILID